MSYDEQAGIDIRIDQDDKRAVISGPGLGRVELFLKDRAQLRLIVIKFAGQVEKARPLGLPVHGDAAQVFLAFVKKAAWACLRKATDNNYDDALLSARKMLDEAMATAVLRDAPLNVQITDTGGGEYLPWEWLGTRDRASDYISEARTTLGFAAVIYRRVTHSEASRPGDQERLRSGAAADVLDAQPVLPVRFFRNPELERTRVEYRFFQYNDDIELTGPLPELAPGGELSLADQLVDPGYQVPGFPHKRPDQVVHLSCHHEAKGNPETASAFALLMSESVLSFGKEDDPGQEISLDSLGEELEEAENREDITAHRPLIFFNACRGSFYPFTTESVVGVLLRNGNRGMVSTAVRVPDDAAAELGQFFYERLLDGDCSVPEALLYAKWKLIYLRACPLGILYSYYGRPDLRILPTRHAHVEDPIRALWNGGAK
ncbi:MAG TPA: CHAT domain-containing protein [Streptosporangiaceae bacterium]|nr:CHAT domain-containing protein [Streptosporangiaceae bacterium]